MIFSLQGLKKVIKKIIHNKIHKIDKLLLEIDRVNFNFKPNLKAPFL